jgi:hypothetical protein
MTNIKHCVSSDQPNATAKLAHRLTSVYITFDECESSPFFL